MGLCKKIHNCFHLRLQKLEFFFSSVNRNINLPPLKEDDLSNSPTSKTEKINRSFTGKTLNNMGVPQSYRTTKGTEHRNHGLQDEKFAFCSF